MSLQPTGQDWERLLAHIRRATDFTLLIVILPSLPHSRETARILASLLAETPRPLCILEARTAAALPATIAQIYTPDEQNTPHTIWLHLMPAGDSPDVADWPAALATAAGTLNKARGSLIQADTHTLILAGSRELLDILQHHAPDLWSIRRSVAFPEFPDPSDKANRIPYEPIRSLQAAPPPSAVEADAAKALAAADALRDQPGTELDQLRYLVRAAKTLEARGKQTRVNEILDRALSILGHGTLPETPELSLQLNNLGQRLHTSARFSDAEPLMRRALAIAEQNYGSHHPNVAIRLNNLAKLLSDTNRFAEAEPLYRRALAIDEQSYGPHHPEVAIDLNNLAELLRGTNRLAEAEPLYRRALAIDEQSYGPHHPDVAVALNNLAGLLASTNHLAEAEPLNRRALAIAEQSYGPHHPTVATALNNLAILLNDTDRREEAAPLCRRALLIRLCSFAGVPGVHSHVRDGVRNYVIASQEMGLAKDVWMPKLFEIFQEAGVSEEKMKEIIDAVLEKS